MQIKYGMQQIIQDLVFYDLEKSKKIWKQNHKDSLPLEFRSMHKRQQVFFIECG
jgi:hypothetical protein